MVASSVTAEVSDSKIIQGTWAPVKAELGGQPMPEATLKKITLELHNGKYEVSVEVEPDKGTYTVDSSTKPRSMVITGTDGPNRGKTFPAIYELEGDTLRVCYDLSGKQRPAEFKTMAGTLLYLVSYHRSNE
jgi:uncharacterized protein (TIGR03067 family)